MLSLMLIINIPRKKRINKVRNEIDDKRAGKKLRTLSNSFFDKISMRLICFKSSMHYRGHRHEQPVLLWIQFLIG